MMDTSNPTSLVIYFVEQVGYDPTPSDFQSAAMTTSATAPKLEMRISNLLFFVAERLKVVKPLSRRL